MQQSGEGNLAAWVTGVEKAPCVSGKAALNLPRAITHQPAEGLLQATAALRPALLQKEKEKNPSGLDEKPPPAATGVQGLLESPGNTTRRGTGSFPEPCWISAKMPALQPRAKHASFQSFKNRSRAAHAEPPLPERAEGRKTPWRDPKKVPPSPFLAPQAAVWSPPPPARALEIATPTLPLVHGFPEMKNRNGHAWRKGGMGEPEEGGKKKQPVGSTAGAFWRAPRLTLGGAACSEGASNPLSGVPAACRGCASQRAAGEGWGGRRQQHHVPAWAAAEVGRSQLGLHLKAQQL